MVVTLFIFSCKVEVKDVRKPFPEADLWRIGLFRPHLAQEAGDASLWRRALYILILTVGKIKGDRKIYWHQRKIDFFSKSWLNYCLTILTFAAVIHLHISWSGGRGARSNIWCLSCPRIGLDWTAGPMFEAIVLFMGGYVSPGNDGKHLQFPNIAALLCCGKYQRTSGMSEQGNQ